MPAAQTEYFDPWEQKRPAERQMKDERKKPFHVCRLRAGGAQEVTFMNKRFLSMLLAALMLLCLLPFSALAQESEPARETQYETDGGETPDEQPPLTAEELAQSELSLDEQALYLAAAGTSETPLNGAPASVFYISTGEQLADLAAKVNAGASWAGGAWAEASFRQVADIDLSACASDEETGKGGWTPIGSGEEHPFKGEYDGGGHAVTNLTSIGGQTLGLFGYVQGGTIVKLGVLDCELDGTGAVGAIAGQLKEGSVRNCFSTGTLGTGKDVGGLVGLCIGDEAVSRVINTWSTAAGTAGGIAGRCSGKAELVNGVSLANDTIAGAVEDGASLTNCYTNAGAISFEDTFGGDDAWTYEDGRVPGFGTTYPMPEPAASPTPEPTASPTPEPTASPTPEPVSSPTPEPVSSPTPTPVSSPTPTPVSSPTPEPASSPTPEPASSPTPEPASSPTPEPAFTPTPTPAENKGVYVTVTAEITGVPFAYTGSAIEPAVTVKAGDEILDKSEYSVHYVRNTNAGTARAVIKDAAGGKYDFADISVDFTIGKADVTLRSANISRPYNGQPLTNGKTAVTAEGMAAGEAFDFDFTGSRTDVGSAENSFTAKDSATAKLANYNITYKPGTLTVSVPAGVGTAVETLTKDNVTSAERKTAEDTLAEVNRYLGMEPSAAEKTELEALKQKLDGLIERLNAAKAAMESKDITAADGKDKSNVKAADKPVLEKAKTALEKALQDFGGNYTQAEKKTLSDKLDRVKAALNALAEAERRAQAPGTGDSAHPVLWIVLAAAAVAAIAALVIVKKKKKDE